MKITPRRTASVLFIAMVVLIVWAYQLSKSNSPIAEVSGETTNVNIDVPAHASHPLARRVSPIQSRPLTESESALNQLEDEFYRQFPLALKFRDYQNPDYRNPEMEALSERMKTYMEEPNDVRTKNLRSGNLNIILELAAPLMMKENLVTNSELGQMLRVTFTAPRWGWGHTLRNLDSRISGSTAREPVIDSVEKLVAAFQEREERIINYCRKMQEEAAMPDYIVEDIEKMAHELITRSVVSAYLEKITPPELKEARIRVAREAKERSSQ